MIRIVDKFSQARSTFVDSLHRVFITFFLGTIGIREAGVIESSGVVDVMDGEGEEEEDDDNDDDDHEDEDEEGGSDMDEEGADIIGDDSFRIYEEDDIYLPFDEGSGQ